MLGTVDGTKIALAALRANVMRSLLTMLGIVIGYLAADTMNENYMRILVGLISLLFGLQALLGWQGRTSGEHNVPAAGLFGAVAGFTSFSIHAGGPPFTMYLMPKGLPPLLFAGTAGLFFAAVNARVICSVLNPSTSSSRVGKSILRASSNMASATAMPRSLPRSLSRSTFVSPASW